MEKYTKTFNSEDNGSADTCIGHQTMLSIFPKNIPMLSVKLTSITITEAQLITA